MYAGFDSSLSFAKHPFALYLTVILFMCPYIARSKPKPDAVFKSGPYVISVFHDTTLFNLVPTEMMMVERVSKGSRKLIERWLWTTPDFAESITDDESNEKMEDLICDSLLKKDAFRMGAPRDTIIVLDSTISFVDSNGDSVNGYVREFGDSTYAKITRAINGSTGTATAVENLLGAKDSISANAILVKQPIRLFSFFYYGSFRIYSEVVARGDHQNYSSYLLIKHGDHSIMYKAFTPDLDSNKKLEKAINEAFKLMDHHHPDPEDTLSQSVDPPLQR